MVTKKVSKKTEKKDSSKMMPSGLIAYILGIIAIVQSFVNPFTGIILSIIGLVFSKKENSIISKKAKKLNMIALILGIIFLVSIILLSLYFPAMGNLGY